MLRSVSNARFSSRLLGSAFSLLALMRPTMADAQTESTDWRAVAAKIVERMGLVRGERVLLAGVAGESDALVPLLRAAIRAAGATDRGAGAERSTPPPEGTTEFTRGLSERSEPSSDEYLRTVDVAVMLPGLTASDPVYASMQRVLRGGRGRTVHFHWAGAYDLDGVLMANSLHYVENQAAFIRECESHMNARRYFLLVEYDTSEASRWIPYPVSRTRLATLFERAGYSSVRVLRSRPSLYRRASLYAIAVGPL